MKNLKRKISFLGIFLWSLIAFMPTGKAISGTFEIKGSEKQTVNSAFTLDVAVVNNGGNIASIGGDISVDDSSCVKINSIEAIDVFAGVNGNRINLSSPNGKSGNFTIVRIKLSAGANACTTNVNLKNAKITFTEKDASTGRAATNLISLLSKKITVGEKEETPLSNDATLKSLTTSTGSLSPSFSSNNKKYTMEVDENVTSIQFNGIPNQSGAKITSGKTCNISSTTTCNIEVTAEDGSKETYVVQVTQKKNPNSGEDKPNNEDNNNNNNNNDNNKPSSSGTTVTKNHVKSNDNYLSSLLIAEGDISPKFNKNTSNYSIVIPNDVSSLNIHAKANHGKSKVTISGNENLQVGENTITVTVTAEDGSTRTYTIHATKKEESSNNKLSSLVVDQYSISPNFNKNIFEYDLTVPYDENSLNIKALAENKNAKVEISGDKNLKEGNNVVLIKVTDENGFVQYYTLNVKKEAKKEAKFLGLTWKQWLLVSLIAFAFGLLLFLLLLLLKRKKDKDEKNIVPFEDKQTPIIEFKPEFNFSSKNGTDDDTVEEGGTIYQFRNPTTAKPKDSQEVPYDPYDETVTKDEIVDAIHEAMETKDPAKLKMLLDQEELNKRKKELKEKENENL